MSPKDLVTPSPTYTTKEFWVLTLTNLFATVAAVLAVFDIDISTFNVTSAVPGVAIIASAVCQFVYNIRHQREIELQEQRRTPVRHKKVNSSSGFKKTS